jgi:hypothetical protein
LLVLLALCALLLLLLLAIVHRLVWTLLMAWLIFHLSSLSSWLARSRQPWQHLSLLDFTLLLLLLLQLLLLNLLLELLPLPLQGLHRLLLLTLGSDTSHRLRRRTNNFLGSGESLLLNCGRPNRHRRRQSGSIQLRRSRQTCWRRPSSQCQAAGLSCHLLNPRVVDPDPKLWLLGPRVDLFDVITK